MNGVSNTAIQGDQRHQLIRLLRARQAELGYLPGESLIEVACELGLPLSDVYGTATFYSFLATRPRSRNVIRVCKSLPCFLKSSHLVIHSVRRELGIAPGETTADGGYSLELTNCIGSCDQAPAMMINHDVHCNLTAAKISRILQKYR